MDIKKSGEAQILSHHRPMTFENTANVERGFWGSDTPFRCTTNSSANTENGKVRPKRDFQFQVIQVRQGPKWFIWPSNKDGSNLSQASTAFSDDENRSVVDSSARRSIRTLNRRMPSNGNGQGDLCKVTATNQTLMAPLSEPTTRRLNCQQVANNCGNHNPSILPMSSDSCSSNLSAMSSTNSSTFQILSVARKWESDDEMDETVNTSGGSVNLYPSFNCSTGKSHDI